MDAVVAFYEPFVTQRRGPALGVLEFANDSDYEKVRSDPRFRALVDQVRHPRTGDRKTNGLDPRKR